jgi:hypothetical protein
LFTKFVFIDFLIIFFQYNNFRSVLLNIIIFNLRFLFNLTSGLNMIHFNGILYFVNFYYITAMTHDVITEYVNLSFGRVFIAVYGLTICNVKGDH